jgi:molecular chaperone DnaJ
MPTKRDYYEILSLERAAGADDIRRAYRRLALKFHPDNVKGDAAAKKQSEDKFKEMAEAYEVLRDPDTRQRYDQFGHEGLRGAGVHDFSGMGFGDIFSMFEDILGGMGGAGGGHGRSRRRGYDLETEVELTLQDVVAGVDRTLEFERLETCGTCNGSGAKPGTMPKRCGTCGGYGQVEAGGGFFRMVRTCPACGGAGQVVSEPCPACHGAGRQKKSRKLTVHVPAGVEEGQAVRVRGEGEAGEPGAGRGDLLCYVRVKEHAFLARHGRDLLCQVPISFSQAALGASVEVPTLAGKEQVMVPPGTQHGEPVRLRGRGLPDIRDSRRGDQIVQFLIEVPKRLTRRQQELLRELAASEDVDVTPARKGFFDKLKKHFG